MVRLPPVSVVSCCFDVEHFFPSFTLPHDTRRRAGKADSVSRGCERVVYSVLGVHTRRAAAATFAIVCRCRREHSHARWLSAVAPHPLARFLSSCAPLPLPAARCCFVHVLYVFMCAPPCGLLLAGFDLSVMAVAAGASSWGPWHRSVSLHCLSVGAVGNGPPCAPSCCRRPLHTSFTHTAMMWCTRDCV